MSELKFDEDSLFVHAFNHAPIGMALVGLDGRWLKVNASLCKIVGYSNEELLATTFQDITFQDDLNLDLEYSSKLLDGKIESYQMEKRYRHKWGHLVWVLLSGSLIRNEQRQPLYFIAQIKDITDRKKAEETLEKSEKKYRILAETSRDIIAKRNLDGLYTYCSPACRTLLGYEPEELIGTSYFEYIHPEDYAELKKRYPSQMPSLSGVHSYVCRIRRKDGTFIWFETVLTAIRDPKTQEPTELLSISRDISERKKAEELMLQSEKLSVAGQLAAGIAHEIRNPITAIKGFLHLMQDEFRLKKDFYQIINSEIDRIELILSELLLLAKPQEIKFERYDVQTILSQVAMLLESEANLSNIRLITRFEPDLPSISCDENQLKQVFINFLKNAMEAMPHNGEIQIQVVREETDHLLVQIVDQGVGIPEDVLAKLGQPFFTTKENGTGLGVMISRKIIENHGGNLNIKSQVNKGTTIEVRFPITI